MALTQQPPGSVTVTVASSDTTAVTVNPTALTFTAASWDQPQTVDVTAIQDVDYADEGITVALESNGLDSRAVAAATDDNDTQSVVIEPGSLALTEGFSGDVNVRLAFAPAGTATVHVASLSTGVATISPSTLSFDATNYGISQPVTITAVNDQDLVEATTTVRAQILAEGLQSDATVNVTDDDTQIVVTQEAGWNMTEGESKTLHVRLGFQPISNTTVTLQSSDALAAGVSPTSLTFTPSDWNTYKNVTVSAPQDDDVATHDVTITASANAATARDVAVHVVDDDTQEILVSAPNISLIEGESGSVDVHLRYRPAGTVIVAATSSDPDRVTMAPLTFTTANWNIDQPLSVTSQQDGDLAIDQVPVTLSLAGAVDKEVTVAVFEDDHMQFLFSWDAPHSPTVVERTWGAVDVRMSHAIDTDVTAMIYTSNSATATTSVATATFTPSNWWLPQRIDVIPVIDDDSDNETFNVVANAPGVALDSAQMQIDDVSGYAGHAGPFTEHFELGAGQVVATRFTTTTELYIERLAVDLPFYSTTQQVMLAFYHDDDGRPSYPYVVAGPYTLDDGHISLEIPGGNPVYFAPNSTRWIAVMFSGSSTVRAEAEASGTRCVATTTFANGMPAPFPASGTCGTAARIQAYGVGYAPWF